MNHQTRFSLTTRAKTLLSAVRFAVAGTALALLAACGQKGPLVLPAAPASAAALASAPAASAASAPSR